MNKQELTYWVSLALFPKMWTKRKNEIFAACFTHSPQISIIDLFENTSHWNTLGLSDEEQALFIQAREQLPNVAFLVEELLAQGYDILPVTVSDYPKALKQNLKYNSPIVVYTKGNKALLNEPSIAIVGSRNADETSLAFTDNVAKRAVAENKVVVSGFAKGVDKQALDSALVAAGKSIIVLPQGIMTFAAGFKQYFKDISQGRVLVMSVFAPKAPWSVEFAMARNPIIYGLATEIFVAQSDDKGGTWSGAIDGLRKNRPIFVRVPEPAEKNANMLLIQKGAVPVDIQGTNVTLSPEELKSPEQKEMERINTLILNILNRFEKTSCSSLKEQLKIDWGDTKLKKHLASMSEIEMFKEKNRNYYRLKGKAYTTNLFSGNYCAYEKGTDYSDA